MRSLSTVLAQEKNDLFSSGVWVPLVQIDFESPVGTVYFCGSMDSINYDGNDYTPFPMIINFQDDTLEGRIPDCNIQLSNVSRVIEEYLNDLDGAADTPVTLTFFNTAATGEDYSDLTWNYFIMSAVSDEQFVTFTLGVYNWFEKKFPTSVYHTLMCRWKYFKGYECGYGGPESSCDRTYDTCDSYGNTHRFGGFVGLADKTVSFLLGRI